MKKSLLFLFIMLLSTTLFADRLEDIKKRGYLKAGVKYDFKPFGFIENGRVVGFDIDMLLYIAKNLGVKIRFQQVSSKTRIPMVVANSVDIVAASMTHKVNRDDRIDFTVSYFFDGQAMLVRTSDSAQNYTDFSNRTVGAVIGSSSGDNFRKLLPSAKIELFQEYGFALKALEDKEIDAITTDLVWCSVAAKDSNGKFRVLDKKLSYEPYGMGIPENESNLRDKVNFAIQNSVKDGTYEKLYIKWFGEKPTELPELWPM